MIDTLAYAKHLEENGFERRQAEALAAATSRYPFPELVTKQDLPHEIISLRQKMRQEIGSLRQEVQNLATRLEAAIQKAQLQSIGVMAALLGLALAIGKLL